MEGGREGEGRERERERENYSYGKRMTQLKKDLICANEDKRVERRSVAYYESNRLLFIINVCTASAILVFVK